MILQGTRSRYKRGRYCCSFPVLQCTTLLTLLATGSCYWICNFTCLFSATDHPVSWPKCT